MPCSVPAPLGPLTSVCPRRWHPSPTGTGGFLRSYSIVTSNRNQRHHPVGHAAGCGGGPPATVGRRADTGQARPTGVGAYKRAGPEATEVPVLGGLGQAHIDGLETLGTFLKIELDRLTLFE